MDLSNIIQWVPVILVGAAAGWIASRLMKGNDNGFLINALLGIAGAIVGGWIFSTLGLTPGVQANKALEGTFNVSAPKFVGQLVSATIGAVLILFVTKLLRGRK